MIFLNLFLAILLENFDDNDEEKQEQASLSMMEETGLTVKTVSLKIKNKCSMYFLKCRRCFGGNNKQKNDEADEINSRRELFDQDAFVAKLSKNQENRARAQVDIIPNTFEDSKTALRIDLEVSSPAGDGSSVLNNSQKINYFNMERTNKLESIRENFNDGSQLSI
jgi:hypothetical protein